MNQLVHRGVVKGLKGCLGRWLRALFVLLEDLGSIPSMHMEAHNHP